MALRPLVVDLSDQRSRGCVSMPVYLPVNLSLGMLLLLGVMILGSSGMSAKADESDVDTPVYVKATFAGGCFWCMEPPYDKLEGVLSTTSGYIGGHKKNPSYQEVSAGTTGHAEAVEILYDPAKISYEDLLEVFWHNIDPLVEDRQFCDTGSQYRTAIFYHNEEQKRLAEQSKKALEESGRFDKPIVTEIVPATEFYRAETYHQDYYKKNPFRYNFYRYSCGRDQRLEELWGSATHEDAQ